MKITIIGWYGTETIGDRAILASLLKRITSVFPDADIFLGSIYPFFTERTVLEDAPLWEKLTGRRTEVRVFDSRRHGSLDHHIRLADAVVVGGGPLCDMVSLYMLEYALARARQLHKKTALLGCGIGPLTQKRFIASAREIVKNADAAVFRDQSSLDWCAQWPELRRQDLAYSIDPAVFCALDYLKRSQARPGNVVVANLRQFTDLYKMDASVSPQAVDQRAVTALERLSGGAEVLLVPMCSFAPGMDDRAFLNRVAHRLPGRASVANLPPTLEETMQLFLDARFCIGMRFHSVVLQTLLNGSNYILDYTHPEHGKIAGFIRALNAASFYQARTVNLQRAEGFEQALERLNLGERFIPPSNFGEEEQRYLDALKMIG